MDRIDLCNPVRSPASSAFESLPRRIFIDSCTVQTLRRYGEFIYDGGYLPAEHKPKATPATIRDVIALRNICQVTSRANFHWIVSDNSRKEAQAKRDPNHLSWHCEIANYAQVFLADAYATPESIALADRLDETKFGYLGEGDRLLLKDAVFFRCDTFLTTERKLPKNADHIAREIGLRVMSPVAYWEQLRPWAALW